MQSNLILAFCRKFKDLALLLGALQDPLFDGALTDEAVDGHLLGLTQAVSPVHGLLVHRGVPVAVVEDHLTTRTRKLAFYTILLIQIVEVPVIAEMWSSLCPQRSS